MNLIGDHTDYNQGLALPMAIDLGTTVAFTPGDRPDILVMSAAFPESATVPLSLTDGQDLTGLQPSWAHLIAAMADTLRLANGGVLRIEGDLPIGSGLSSSASLCVALCEVFGVNGSAESVAALCQAAEQRTGVPVGAMDPLICAGGQEGHALLIDFSALESFATTSTQVPMPTDVDVIVVDSGQRRSLRNSAYAAKVAECESAALSIGPLGQAGQSDLDQVADPLLRRRARHVITECLRVREFAAALADNDAATAGSAMLASHRSLAEDYEVSTPVLDELVAHLASLPGVHGARLTGAGFGGCVVALSQPGAIDTASLATPAWRLRPAAGTVARRR